MKAAQVVNEVMTVIDIPDPVPGPEEALVRLSASGVCHSDLHLARGDWMGVPRGGGLGHEGVGIVEALGPGAERFTAVGSRVILGLGGMGGYWCGTCDYCMSGRPRLCPHGRPIMGTFAEKITVWAPSLVVLPDSIPDHEAPLACGGLTAYSAIRKLLAHNIQPGRTIGIIGAAGGLGHYAVQIANAFGYRVVGVDVGEDRLDFIRSLGAEHVVGAQDAAAYAATLGGVDAVLVFAARLSGFELGMQMVKRGGLFVAVGIPPSSEGNLQLNPWQFFLKDTTIIYSAIGTVQEMREVVALAEQGKLTTHVSRRGTLSEVDTILDELEASKYLGRAIITDFTR